MPNRALLTPLLLLAIPACGDDGAQPDAAPDAPVIDSGPLQRLNVQVDDMTVCPDGWTEGPTATEEPNLIEIVASCEEGASYVQIQFAPKPTEGGTAPCIQETLRMSDGPQVICRVMNEVRNDPEGMLTLSEGEVSGECGCMGDSGSMGGASFQLPLQ